MALSLVIAGLGSGYGLYQPRVCPAPSGETCFEVAVAHRRATEVKCVATSDEGVRVLLEHV